MLLTERESEIVDLIKQRMTNRQIAASLHISENTVKSAVKLIFKKLDIRKRRELYQ